MLIIFTCFSKIASLACSSTKNGLAKTKPDPLSLLLSPTLKVGAGSLLNAGVGSFFKSSTFSLSDSPEDGSFLNSVLLKSMTADRFFTKCIEPTGQTGTLLFYLTVIMFEEVKKYINSNFYLHDCFLWVRRGVFSFRVTSIISY